MSKNSHFEESNQEKKTDYADLEEKQMLKESSLPMPSLSKSRDNTNCHDGKHNIALTGTRQWFPITDATKSHQSLSKTQANMDQDHSHQKQKKHAPSMKIEDAITIEEGIQKENAVGQIFKEANKANQNEQQAIPIISDPAEKLTISNTKKSTLCDQESKMAAWMNDFQNSIKSLFSLEIFGCIAQKLNSWSTAADNLKDTISLEDLMKFSAFLLSTGISKKSTISDYLEIYLGAPPLVSKKLFAAICESLSYENSPLQFSQMLSKPYEEARQNSSKLIRTNYLGLFEEFNIFFGQKSSYRRTNDHRFRARQLIQDIPVIKQEPEAPIPQNILDLISRNKLKEEYIPPSQQNESQNNITRSFLAPPAPIQIFKADYVYCYNPKTLALCDINEGNLQTKRESENSSMSRQGGMFQNATTSSCFENELDSNLDLVFSFGKKTAQCMFFENYFNLLDSQNEETFALLQTVCQSRPLRTVDLQEYESNGLRAFAESLFTMCINIYQKTNEQSSKRIPFKNILNKIIENLMERANQITLNNNCNTHSLFDISSTISPYSSRVIGITTQQHTFIKTKHCNFCIVCQQNGKYTKSKYSCSICQHRFGRCIALCMYKCDQLFHDNPLDYLSVASKIDKSGDGNHQKKKDIIIKKVQDISISDYLEQLEMYSKSISLLMKTFNESKSIALEPVYLKSPANLAKRKLINKPQPKSQNPKAGTELLFGNVENLPFVTLKLDEIESIQLSFPPYVETAPDSIQCTVKSVVKRQRKKQTQMSDLQDEEEEEQGPEEDHSESNESESPAQNSKDQEEEEEIPYEDDQIDELQPENGDHHHMQLKENL